MKKTPLSAVGAIALLASMAQAQSWSGQHSSSGGGPSSGPPNFMPRSQRVENIGKAGQVIFGVDRVTGLGFCHNTDKLKATETTGVLSTTTSTEAVQTYTEVTLFGGMVSSGGLSLLPRLSLDYLPLDGLTLGGSFTVAHQSGESRSRDTSLGATDPGSKAEPSTTLVLLEPRVGYAIPFDDTLGIWPRASFMWAHLTSHTTTPAQATPESGRTEDRIDLFQLSLEALFVISPFKHFALLVGPFADIGLGGSGESKTTTTSAAGITSTDPPTTHSPSYSSFGLTGSVVVYFP